MRKQFWQAAHLAVRKSRTFFPARRLGAALSVVAMLLMVTGPVLSHHYAELSPYHSHVFSTDIPSNQHTHDTASHHDEAGETGVLSVSEHSAAGSGPVQFVVSTGTVLTPRLVTSFVIYDAESAGADGFIRPPERPPRYS